MSRGMSKEEERCPVEFSLEQSFVVYGIDLPWSSDIDFFRSSFRFFCETGRFLKLQVLECSVFFYICCNVSVFLFSIWRFALPYRISSGRTGRSAVSIRRFTLSLGLESLRPKFYGLSSSSVRSSPISGDFTPRLFHVVRLRYIVTYSHRSYSEMKFHRISKPS